MGFFDWFWYFPGICDETGVWFEHINNAGSLICAQSCGLKSVLKTTQMSQTASWESLLIPANVCSDNSKQKVEWGKDNIFDWEHNRSPGISCFFRVLWPSRDVREKRNDRGTSGNSYQPGWNMQQPAGCFYVLCSGLILAPREGTDLGENFNGHMVQPCQTLCRGIWQHMGTSGCLATSSLALRPGTNTWYPVGRGLYHLCQLSIKAFAEEMFPKFPSPFRFCAVYWTTARCSHQYGKLCVYLSLLHHCSHSACFCVCAISQWTVPTLVFDVPGTGKLLVYSVGMEMPGTYTPFLSFLKAWGM